MPSRVRHVAAALRDRIPWTRLGGLFAVVTIGLSQIVFNLILENQDYFPGGGWFYFWVIVWVQLLPLALLFGVDAILVRWAGQGRAFQAWRAVLYTALFFSFLRQVQIHHPRPFLLIIGWIPVIPLLLATGLLFFLLCVRSRRIVHQYLAYLGVLALILTAIFVGRSDMMARSWRDGRGAPTIRPGTEGMPHVILITFDELSYDVIAKEEEPDPETFPTFATLSKDGAWFTRATTNHSWTHEAVPTMLSGFLFPPEDAPTVFDRLPPGYEVWLATGATPAYRWIRSHARENHRIAFSRQTERLIRRPFEVPAFLLTALAETPISRSPFQVQPARRLLPPVLWGNNQIEANHHREVEEFLGQVEALGETPTFLFWHCWFPHFPFILEPDGTQHDRPHVSFRKAPWTFEGRIDPATYTPDAVLRNYRAQARYADSILRRCVETLQRRGLYDNVVLIVTSDHGLRTWGELEPAAYPDAISNWTPGIPLVLRGPGVKPGRYDVDYQHVDLGATLLDVLGYPDAASDTEGVSGFSSRRPDRPKVFEHRNDGSYFRYVYDPDRREWPRTSTRGLVPAPLVERTPPDGE